MTTTLPSSTVATAWTPLATNLAARWADLPHEIDDLRQEGLLALHRALVRTPRPQYPATFAGRVMERAMWRARRRRPLGCAPDDFGRSVPEGEQIALLPTVHTDLAVDDYLTALESMCGGAAREVAAQLIAPSGRVVKDLRLEADSRSGCRARVRREVPRELVRRALGITRRRWRVLILEVEAFTRTWLAEKSAS